MPTKYKGKPQEILALNTFIKLTRATDALLGRLNQRGTLGKLTSSQFGVLEALYHLGPLCQTELSNKILRSTGNMTMVIDNLEKRNLVRRERHSEDRRMVRVSLTETGQELIAQVFPRQLEAIVEEINVLTPQEQEVLSELCRKLGKKAQA
jgi:MarR family 2-MHQ and catechol resistance regulon transcriptional repressor